MTGSFGHARVNDPQFAYKPLRFTPQGKRIDVGVYRQAEQAILQMRTPALASPRPISAGSRLRPTPHIEGGHSGKAEKRLEKQAHRPQRLRMCSALE
jgi:hypothetical protein